MEWFKTSPDKETLIDAATGRTMTYGELDEVTSKVYAYLANKGIGRESFVMIDLPRGIDVTAVFIGVWRAGAAYVPVEEGMPAEKKEYVYKDLGCSLLLDSKEYEQILATPGREGYAETGRHDACYAIYTSGTTGKPKGVIQEYGILEKSVSHYRYDGKYLAGENDRFPIISPLSFIAGTIILNIMSYLGAAVVLMPFAAIMDKEKFLTCMSDYKITEIFLTPSYFSMHQVFNPEFKAAFLSSEPAKNVFREGITIYNTYFQSESGFMIAVFKIDRDYDVTPVGKSPCAESKIVILDEDGNEAKDGEIGEVCFENPYFRGYINLPQDSERAFRGGLYHSGDMGKRLADGNIVILGRVDDMVQGQRQQGGAWRN